MLNRKHNQWEKSTKESHTSDFPAKVLVRLMVFVLQKRRGKKEVEKVCAQLFSSRGAKFTRSRLQFKR